MDHLVKDNIVIGTTLGSEHLSNHHCQCLDESWMEIMSFCLTLPILAMFNLIAWLNTTRRRLKQGAHQQQLETNVEEDITQDETYYASRWGYHCQQHTVITQDGYQLNLYRFSRKRKFGDGKPILIGHGLFQCSGAFVLDEKDSLVFTLVDQGYDVWTGNNRAVGSLAHVSVSSNHACYWDWGLKELALYDFPAMLDYVRATTGYKRVGYIGHSQGNAQAFIALSLKPELANKMSCFIALAPAVIAGSLVSTTRLVLDWLEGWGRQGVCLHLDKSNTMDDNGIYARVPLAIIYGKDDYLVDGAAFVRSFKGYEDHGVVDQQQPSSFFFSFPSLELVHVECIPAYEHMDTIWGHDSKETTHPVILNALAGGTWK
ncbi:Alpha/Beta hydrolase protein [Chlamydoabsidia padenii]|nr:Alpha/Beta hydrolase protein [Chlamydoabsidia padenii]